MLAKYLVFSNCAFWKCCGFKKCGMKLNFLKSIVFGKNYQKVFFEKAHECLTNTYKSGSLNCKLQKMTGYIYIYIWKERGFFILITSLNASYGHNIFTKISS